MTAAGAGRVLAAMALLAALGSPMQSQANDGEPAPPPRAGAPAEHVIADRLDLRVRPAAVKAPRFAHAQSPASRSPAIRLEPRKSLIEQGIEGSREALIACQQGAYPGATVSASAVKVAGGDAQPDHCYRF